MIWGWYDKDEMEAWAHIFPVTLYPTILIYKSLMDT